MNYRSVSNISATIMGTIFATIIVSLVISGIIYFFKRKSVKTKKERKNLFLGILIPTLIIVFIIECILLMTRPRV